MWDSGIGSANYVPSWVIYQKLIEDQWLLGIYQSLLLALCRAKDDPKFRRFRGEIDTWGGWRGVQTGLRPGAGGSFLIWRLTARMTLGTARISTRM